MLFMENKTCRVLGDFKRLATAVGLICTVYAAGVTSSTHFESYERAYHFDNKSEAWFAKTDPETGLHIKATGVVGGNNEVSSLRLTHPGPEGKLIAAKGIVIGGDTFPFRHVTI